MHTEIQTPGATYGLFAPLAEEAAARFFRIRGCDPFYFRRTNGDLEVNFKGSSGERKVARISPGIGTLDIRTEKGIGKAVHDHIVGLAPTLFEAASACARLRQEREARLLEDGYALIGPRDGNRKVAVLRIRAADALSLAGFAGQFRRALPDRLDAIGQSETRPGYFKVNLGMVGEKGVTAPLMSIRFAGARVETECADSGEKARGEFADFLFETMKARRDRVLADPAVQEAVRATLADAETTPDWFEETTRHDATARPFRFGTGYSAHTHLLLRAEPFTIYGGARHEVEIGHGLTAQVNFHQDRGNVIGLSVGGEPISFAYGFLPGINGTQKIWSTACAKALIARPDLFPREAATFLNIRPAVTDEQITEEVTAAIRTGIPAADVPALEF